MGKSTSTINVIGILLSVVSYCCVCMTAFGFWIPLARFGTLSGKSVLGSFLISKSPSQRKCHSNNAFRTNRDSRTKSLFYKGHNLFIKRQSTHYSMQQDSPYRATTEKYIDLTEMTKQQCNYPTLTEFLFKVKLNTSNNFVIGNEAGDADSVISAIGIAYLLSIQSESNSNSIAPVVSITRNDLETQRPEILVLLQELCKISTKEQLIYVNDWKEGLHAGTPYNVILSDHNQFGIKLSTDIEWKVTRIYDHHLDLGHHTDTCYDRNIAFVDEKALVASTCTLVVEELQNTFRNGIRYPADLSLLLLGVILLDSVNMEKLAGKVTGRDIAAIDNLLSNTEWGALHSLQPILDTDTVKPDTTKLFNLLQNAKFSKQFWNSLSIRNALRLDYKFFTSHNSFGFGVSTVLLPLSDFVSKDRWIDHVNTYMDELSIDFLGVMFASTDDDDESQSRLRRQIILIGRKTFPIAKLISFLKLDGRLQLKEIQTTFDSNELFLYGFDQEAVEASRKQVIPILLQFFHEISSAL